MLDSQEDIIEWYKSTGFKPYLDQLDAPGQEEFLAALRAQVLPFYPPQADGKVLFEFERLFFTAVK